MGRSVTATSVAPIVSIDNHGGLTRRNETIRAILTGERPRQVEAERLSLLEALCNGLVSDARLSLPQGRVVDIRFGLSDYAKEMTMFWIVTQDKGERMFRRICTPRLCTAHDDYGKGFYLIAKVMI